MDNGPMKRALAFLCFLIPACGSPPKNSAAPELSEVQDSRLNYRTKMDSDSENAFGLQSVRFDYRSADINDQAKATLLANAQVLKSHPDLQIQLEGHTDARAGIAYNLQLGEKRALAVQKFLVIQGVSKARLSVVSYGKEQPLPGPDNAEQDRKNRRVNFVVTTLE